MRADKTIDAIQGSRILALLPRLAWLSGALAVLCSAGAATADPASEAAVKAAFVYNFAKFVEWPAGASAEPGSEVRICTAGLDAELASSVAALAGKSVQARIVSIKSDVKLAEMDACQLLMLGTTGRALAESARGKAGLLTVSDVKGFAAAGGIIELFVEDGKMRFEINTHAAQHASLRISSQLLKLARVTPEQ
jgi:hypothetical protein